MESTNRGRGGVSGSQRLTQSGPQGPSGQQCDISGLDSPVKDRALVRSGAGT